jgi:hypothetical protein
MMTAHAKRHAKSHCGNQYSSHEQQEQTIRAAGAASVRGRVNIPFLQLVMIASCVNVNQHSGSGSILLLSTGGSIAVRLLGSTGCRIVALPSSVPLMLLTTELFRAWVEP